MHGINGMNWGMSWGMGFGWIIGLALLVLVIWAITKISRSNTPSFSERQKTALEILKDRFAKGEINRQEYEEKKRVLLQ